MIIGDTRIPRGRVAIHGCLHQNVNDDRVENNEKRLKKFSSEENLPWPIPSSTRPDVKTYVAEGQWAYVVCFL